MQAGGHVNPSNAPNLTPGNAMSECAMTVDILDFEPKAAGESFKCMFSGGGCQAGTANSDRTGGAGLWHHRGDLRGSYFNHRSNHDDDICSQHWEETKKRHRERHAATSSSREGQAASPPPPLNGTADPAGGRFGFGKGGKRRREESEMSAGAMQGLSTLHATCDEETDDDLPHLLPQSESRHDLATPDEATNIVTRIIGGMRAGMPCPSADGGLRTIQRKGVDVEDTWEKLPQDDIPYFGLGVASFRAEQHKNADGGWTDASKRLAMEEFLVDGKVAFVAPEVFFRKELMEDPRFQVRNEAGAVSGVRMICPTCLSNTKTAAGGWGEVRSVHTASGAHLFAQSRRYGCLNPQCQAVKDTVSKKLRSMEAARVGQFGLPANVIKRMENGDLSGADSETVKKLAGKGPSFCIVEKRCMSLLPLKVQLLYAFDVYARGGAEHDLLDMTLQPGVGALDLHRRLTQAHESKQTERFEQYESFTLKMGGVWPALKAVGHKTLLSGPTAKTIRKYCDETFQEVQPFLQRYICNLSPGRSLTVGTTFRVKGRVIVLLTGALGRIVAFAALNARRMADLLPLLVNLQGRLERLGTEQDLKLVFTDSFCERLAEPKHDLFAKLFAGVARAPHDGSSHKTQILKTERKPFHVLHPEIAKKGHGAPCSAEAFDHMKPCVGKGCLHPSSSVQVADTCSGIRPEMLLPEMCKTEDTEENEAAHSRIDRKTPSQATPLGDLRSQRELSLFVFHENVRVDQAQGICNPNFSAGRFWRQERIESLRKESRLRQGLLEDAASPCAGGGQWVPPELAKENNEPMGFDYLDLYQEEDRVRMAKAFGVELWSLDHAAEQVERRDPVAQGGPGGAARGQNDADFDALDMTVHEREGSPGEGGGGSLGDCAAGGGSGHGADTSDGTKGRDGDMEIDITLAQGLDGTARNNTGGREERAVSGMGDDHGGVGAPAERHDSSVPVPAIGSGSSRARSEGEALPSALSGTSQSDGGTEPGGQPSKGKGKVRGQAGRSRGVNFVELQVQPQTADEISLANLCVAKAATEGLWGRKLWPQASLMYNKEVLAVLTSSHEGQSAVKLYGGLTSGLLLKQFYDHVSETAAAARSGILPQGLPPVLPQAHISSQVQPQMLPLASPVSTPSPSRLAQEAHMTLAQVENALGNEVTSANKLKRILRHKFHQGAHNALKRPELVKMVREALTSAQQAAPPQG